MGSKGVLQHQLTLRLHLGGLTMQMGLMPKEHPRIEGLDIAGRCIPANHVGGDFFQYFAQNGKLSLSIADVTGYAMDAAIPVAVFDGILDSQMNLGDNLDDLFGRLNTAAHRKLPGRTFVCFAMGELDPASHTLRLCNGGCPSPYHFQAATGQITELEVGAYPLGVRPNLVFGETMKDIPHEVWRSIGLFYILTVLFSTSYSYDARLG